MSKNSPKSNYTQLLEWLKYYKPVTTPAPTSRHEREAVKNSNNKQLW